MDALSLLGQGFATALSLENLLWALVGTTLGTVIGILPGIGPALTIALLLPVTYDLDPTSAFIMFAGIYYGAMYGSSTTSILLNTPGESGSIVTALEGNLMARRGRGAAALATAAIGSFVAGLVGTLLLALVAPFAVKVALAFGPAEYTALMLLAFVTVSAMLGDRPLNGLSSLLIGVALGLVGIDTLTGQARFSLGLPRLLDGIDVVIAVVGLFAVGEALYMASRPDLRRAEIIPVEGSLRMTRQEWVRSWRPWLRGTAIGFPFGTLPAGGTEVPTFLSYWLERKLGRRRGGVAADEFGKGAIEGVAGPEAANNAAVAGVLVPLLTLGLPTSATAAILLAAFQQYGLQPGPLLFAGEGTLVWALIASLFIGNVMLLVLNLPLVGLWVKLLAIPAPWLYGGILVFASLGILSLTGQAFDLALLAILGLLGFVMRRLEVPIAPCIVGLILGPLCEEQFRRALSISRGDFMVFLEHPISAAFLALALLALVVPIVLRWRRARRERGAVP
jgi:putative tricarboxylic transport membrane protein